jgi:hypothetical protein
MAIEVKQLIVRGDVRPTRETEGREDRPAFDREELKEEILESCRRMLEELIREGRER